MGKRGPSTLPQSIHKKRGTFREDRHGTDQGNSALNFLSEVPAIPEKLGEYGAMIYEGICVRAVEMGDWITWSDLPLLEQYCVAVEYARKFSGCQAIEKSLKGGSRLSAEFRAWKDAVLVMQQLGARFGLDPSSKTNFNWKKKEDIPDDFTQWKL